MVLIFNLNKKIKFTFFQKKIGLPTCDLVILAVRNKLTQAAKKWINESR